MYESPSVVSVEENGPLDFRKHKIMSIKSRMHKQKIEVYHSWRHGFEVRVDFDAPLFNA